MMLYSQRPTNGIGHAEVENSPSCGGRMETQGNDDGQQPAPLVYIGPDGCRTGRDLQAGC
jgi:hypothetical protein